MNLANVITTVRILLLPVFVTLLVYRRLAEALVVLCLAALTDALDGLAARLLNQRTAIGTFLDPLADRLLGASGFLTLAVLGPLPAWFVITVISRDVIVSLGTLVLYLHEGKIEIAPTFTGKAATAAQSVTIAATILYQIAGRGESAWRLLLFGTAALTVVSGLQYVWRGLGRLGGAASAGGG